jgi:hypothetical protein
VPGVLVYSFAASNLLILIAMYIHAQATFELVGRSDNTRGESDNALYSRARLSFSPSSSVYTDQIFVARGVAARRADIGA